MVGESGGRLSSDSTAVEEGRLGGWGVKWTLCWLHGHKVLVPVCARSMLLPLGAF